MMYRIALRQNQRLLNKNNKNKNNNILIPKKLHLSKGERMYLKIAFQARISRTQMIALILKTIKKILNQEEI